jgi:streptomycin 6-kinase
LRALPETEQDLVIADLLRRLWHSPPAPHPFCSLSDLTDHWSNETLANIEQWPDPGLVREGLRLFRELPRTASIEVLLATDRTIRRIADLLSVDSERVRRWTFARAAAEPRDDWRNDGSMELARAIAP